MKSLPPMTAMRAFITAAGRGSRMGAVTRWTHKGLCRIGGASILDHTVDALAACGIGSIYMVLGYRAEQIRRHFGSSVEYLHNPRFETTGILASFWIAMPVLDGRAFVFTTADHFCRPELIDRCLRTDGDVVSLVQRKDRYEPEDSKVVIENGRIVRFGKDVPLDRAGGEYAGLSVFRAAGSSAFFRELRAVFDSVCRRGYVMDILNQVLALPDVRMTHVTCDENSRIEIDSVADLRRARRLAETILRRQPAS